MSQTEDNETQFKRGADKTRIVVYIDPKLKKRFKAVCATEGLDMSKVVCHFVARFIQGTP